MIWNQWYAVLDSKELKKKNKLYSAKRMGEKLAFWKGKSGMVHCLYDKCAHRGASLSLGKVIDDNTVECPFHGLIYDESGKCILIPSRGRVTPVPDNFRVKSYPAQEKYGFIWIWWGDKREKYPEIPFFKDIDDKFHYLTIKDKWNTHYSRAVENQLDVSHLPFIHYNTIGRGYLTVCDGPVAKFEDDMIQVWLQNRKDTGTPSILPSEMPEPVNRAFLFFKFPNIWQLMLSQKFRIFVAFTPVDEENSILYARFYQKSVRIPILKNIVSWIGKLSSKVILHQDRRVVETQIPKKTSLKMNENLFPADNPIILYRKMRDELIKSNNPQVRI